MSLVKLKTLHIFLKTKMSIDIGGMRHPYNNPTEVFLESDLASKEPYGQFKQWFDHACNTNGILEANAMCLATATCDGKPSARMVLLKSYSKEGFKFFTNYDSRKGKELKENPYASLCFYWEPLRRSVRIEGPVHKLSQQESADYFESRPRASQVGACVSQQSKVIASRDVLTEINDNLTTRYSATDLPVPKPENWGGYIVVPRSVEFWQGQNNRLHDRIRFRRQSESDSSDTSSDGIQAYPGEDGWIYERLSP